jgi:Ca2+-binding RTX toxin-like protein
MRYAGQVTSAAGACDGRVASIGGTDGHDLITGTPGADVIAAGSGRDTVDGRGGNDVICGGPGRDTLIGGRGADALHGGDGSDQLRGGRRRDSLYGGAGADTLVGGDGPDVLQGGAGDDALRGGVRSDGLVGGLGEDTLWAAGGDDSLSGGPGADLLNGVGGSDELGGGNARDTVNGGAGADDIAGGPGDDTMNGGGGSDTCHGAPGADLARTCEVLTDSFTMTLLPRQAWGALPAEPGLVDHEIERITIHHAGDATGTVGPVQFRWWHEHHLDLGWPDIAYHYIVGRDGVLWEGRSWTKAGDTGTDYDPFGHLLVVVEGNFEVDVPTAGQLETLARIVAYGAGRFDVPVTETAGHRDHAATTCPGEHLYTHIASGSIAGRAAEILRAGITLVEE